ncbi:ABC transporter permease [Terrisporobacter petrolearius]|uniref:ABC transporter permease n=1 Tax=Terrisporobacter petrolearius TaxID=1460447 RepID=UPI001D16FAAF|nr:ABC transporter permease [Terrisporobacter petrolearius]MCC3864781.1 ABC transporter permease [Terrisporobacter petrolearius]
MSEVNSSVKRKSSSFKFGIREKTILSLGIFIVFFIVILVVGSAIDTEKFSIDLINKNQGPSLAHVFGTDWIGRDMFFRTLKGLSISMKIGVLSSIISGIIAVILGVIGPTCGKKVDLVITWFIDLVLSVPHTLIIILISMAAGGGLKGIVLGVSLTHWTSLTRVIRAEVMQVKESDYTKIAKNFGKSNLYIAKNHILPHVIPQLLVGIVLIFPHAILHEASVTFLGFGLQSHEPAIGIILSESMKYLTSGKWWLAFFPGLSLVLVSMMVDNMGKKIGKLIDPKTAYN